MQVVLKVVGGKHNGREIKISVPKFVIGRGEETQLRPSSDLVSRNHCCIISKNGQVFVEDMGSRNGTYVNGERLEARHTVRSGDSLRVGRLQFELVLDPARSAKNARVGSVVEAAARTAKAGKAGLDDDVSAWLDDDDEEEQPTPLANAETVQFSAEETQTIETSQELVDTDGVVVKEEQDSSEIASSKKKKKAGKLPPVPSKKSADSKSAADDALKRFFNRR